MLHHPPSLPGPYDNRPGTHPDPRPDLLRPTPAFPDAAELRCDFRNLPVNFAQS